MAISRAGFLERPWQQGAHPLELKQSWPERGLTLLAFEPGFEDPSLCEHGHLIYVLSGTLELVLDDSTERVAQGEAVALDPGTRHRARNAGAEALRLLVVSL